MLYTPENTVKRGFRAFVTLDGTPVDGVFEADDEEGYLLRFLRDGDGKFFLVDDEPAQERMEGVVSVKLYKTP